MNKFLSYIVLVSLVSLNNLTFVFAWNTDPLQSDKQNSIILLDNLENKLDWALETTANKSKDDEIKDKIEQKQAEIEEYINQKQAEIKKEDSKTDIKSIIEDTTKVVTLKAVAWVTPTQDVTESISSQIDVPKKDLEKAQETLIDSLKEWNKYTIMLKSKLTKEDILKLLNKFDKNISLNDMFEEDWLSYFELEILENSLLKKELLENIDSWEVPSNFLWIEVIKPELLKIWDISTSWEEIDKLWWIKRYNTQKYLDKLSSKTKENGKKLQIWIIDTGISYNHPDLKNQISKTIAWYDFVNDDNDALDDQWHGTHVSGTIAWEINWAWVYGVNPYVELVGLKICDSSWFCPTYGVLKALDYAKEKKLDVLNMSLWAKWNVSTSPVCQAIKDITANWTVVVAAAWNSNVNTSTFVPGWCSEAITVWAIDENNSRAVFSNYWDKVDVAAPWVWVYSTYLNNWYKSLNGTSMATPHIVWVVSVLKTFKPELTTKDIKELFKNNALSVQSETNKKIASWVDLDKILSSFWVSSPPNVLPNVEVIKDEIKTQTWNTNQETKTNDETKEQKTSLPQSQQNITQTWSESVSTWSEIKQEQKAEIKEKSPEELWLVNIWVVDESIWFSIQNPEEETTKINSADDSQELSSENVISEKQTIILEKNEEVNTEERINNDSVLINNAEDEIITEVPEENIDENSENENTWIQNSYTCNFNVWWSCYLSLSNANNSSIYSYSASQNWYLSYSASSSQITVYWNKAWTTNFYINKYNSSKKKFESLHTIVITVTQPEKQLKASIWSTTIQNWNTTSVNISDWNGWYSVSSSNTSVATVSWSNTNWTITWKWIWSSTITVKDSKNRSLTFSLSVTARNLILNTSSIAIDKSTYGYFNITDWNGWYLNPKSSSSNLSIYSNWTNAYKVYSTVPWNYTVQVTDSQWKTASVSVNILNPLVVTNFNQSISKYIWETINYSITSWNGNYSVISNNTSVATVSPWYLWTSWIITAKGVGKTTITLKDGAGKSMSIELYVKVKVNIIDTQYTSSVEEWYVWWFYFKVDNTSWVKEAWVQYYNNTSTSISNISWKTQIIPNQWDGEFAWFVLPKTKYTNVRWYVITTWWDTIYTNTYTIIYAWNNWLYAYYGWDGQIIANADENWNYSDEEDSWEDEVNNENSWENYESWYIDSENTSEEWVEVNSIWAFIWVWIFVAWVWLTVYTCDQDWWTSSSCLISWALTFVPVWKIAWFAWKFIPKQMVVNYASSTILWKLALNLGKYIDDLARLGYIAKVKNLVNNSTIIKAGGTIFTKIENLGFKSELQIVSNESLTIKQVFKWTLEWVDMSDIIIEQIKFAWKNPNKFKNILLDNVVNTEILNTMKNKWQKYVIDNWWNIWWLDWMTKKILEKTWKTISEIKIYKDKDMYWDVIYDIQLIIK